MKRFFVCGLVAVGVTLGFSIDAIAAGAAMKVGCFDLQAAVSQSSAGKKLLEELKAEEQKLGSVLEQKGRALMTAKDEYEKKRDKMDEKARSNKEKELSDMYADLQKLRAESSNRLNEEKNAGLEPIIKKVREIAHKIGKSEKFDLILEKSVVHYLGDEKEDLTSRISAELDKGV